MEGSIKIDVKKDGVLFLNVTHLDKDDSIEQKLLGVFLNGALIEGICIRKTGGFTCSDGIDSADKYEISIKH